MSNEPKQSPNRDPFEYAPAWRPDQDDDPVLEGKFTIISEGYSEYGTYPIVTIVDDNGEERAWHAMTQVAKGQLVKAGPRIGHRLRITYGGKVQSKNESREPYTRWRVENLTAPPSPEDVLAKYGEPVGRSSGFNEDPPF